MSLSLEFKCNPAKWQGIRRAASAKGIYVPDTMDGEVEHNGVTVSFQRNGDSLQVSVVKMPWKYKLVPQSLIISKVKEIFEQV